MTEPRVWDPYLTAQDRAHTRRQQRAPRGTGEHPALILVDVYARAFGDRPEPLLDTLERWPNSCGLAGWEALPHLAALLEAARAASVPVVHITADAAVPAWRAARGGAAPDPRQLEAGYAIKEEVAPLPGEPVLRKAAPSAFFGTPLAPLLRQWGVDGVLVAGETTSGCVRATVVDACSHRFAVTVVEECVFDRTEAAHAINLFDMAQKYADVRAVQDVTEELRTRFPRKDG
ncbi:isochorismatase family protein [Streptomyces sp. NPDC050560]|uniref:isochorismatase family protein n=1 Tax=Streptomyces sp. NPDC050560 TaxID=3365630 RepID=UPI0037BC2DD1